MPDGERGASHRGAARDGAIRSPVRRALGKRGRALGLQFVFGAPLLRRPARKRPSRRVWRGPAFAPPTGFRLDRARRRPPFCRRSPASLPAFLPFESRAASAASSAAAWAARSASLGGFGAGPDADRLHGRPRSERPCARSRRPAAKAKTLVPARLGPLSESLPALRRRRAVLLLRAGPRRSQITARMFGGLCRPRRRGRRGRD